MRTNWLVLSVLVLAFTACQTSTPTSSEVNYPVELERVSEPTNLSLQATAAENVGIVNGFMGGSLLSFLYMRNYQSSLYPELDWSTDYCSSSPDSGPGFNFKNACTRHDFGYRNYKRFGVFATGGKDYSDYIFYNDMKADCAARSWYQRPTCYSLAWTYYQAVKNFGS
jgi:Prokaryotic phospholipase A2